MSGWCYGINWRTGRPPISHSLNRQKESDWIGPIKDTGADLTFVELHYTVLPTQLRGHIYIRPAPGSVVYPWEALPVVGVEMALPVWKGVLHANIDGLATSRSPNSLDTAEQ